MYGITGKDALGLFEAYQAVYNPQELTEEQIWEEVENWVNSLIDEGYDLSDYTWEEMYEAYIGEEDSDPNKKTPSKYGYKAPAGYMKTRKPTSQQMSTREKEAWKSRGIGEERAPGVKPYKPQPLKPLPQAKPLSGEKGTGEGYGEDKKFNKPDDRIKRPGTEVPPSKKGGYGRIFKNIPHGIGAHATKTISANTRTRGEDPGAPRSQKIAKDARNPRLSREIIRHPKPQAEEYDVYDLILSHLLDEGYANSLDAAKKIMVNMSQEWITSIID